MAVTRQKDATRAVCEFSIFVLSLLQSVGIDRLGVYGAACSAGRFEDASTPGSCFDCPANTYSTTSGAIGNSTCLSCGKDLSGLVDLASLPGSPSHLNCSCPQGYFSREPGVCEPCALSYYKATIGPEHCLQCPPNSRAMSTGSTSCMCDAGYTPQHSDGIMAARDAQACDGFTPFAGYSPQYPCDSIIGGANAPSQHPGGLCLPCVSGKYKPEAGSMECTECPVGSYRTAAAAVNVTQCAFCPQGRFKLAPGDNGCQGPAFGTAYQRGHRDGPAETALFSEPSGLDRYHNLSSDEHLVIIADKQNHVIRALNLNTPQMLVTTLAGQPAAAAFADGVRQSARFNQPTDVLVLAFNLQALCLIADSLNHRIRVLDLNSMAVATVAGNGAAGHDDGTGETASFHAPCALAAASNSQIVWVADMYNSVIRRLVIGERGGRLASWVSTVEIFDTSGRYIRLLYPAGLAVTPPGETEALYVSDQYQRRLVRIDAALASTANSSSDSHALSINASALILTRQSCSCTSELQCQQGRRTCVPEARVQRSCAQEAVELAYPRGLVTTSAGQLLVAESDKARVRIIEDMHVNASSLAATWSGKMSTLATSTASSASSSQSGPTASTSALATPAGLVLVPTLGGYVLIASDCASHAMRLLFVTERLDEEGEDAPAADGAC